MNPTAGTNSPTGNEQRISPLNHSWAKVIKRAMDLLVSCLFLFTLFPFVFLIVGIGIKLSSPGPVLFRQERTGKDGKTFYILKFRSLKAIVNEDDTCPYNETFFGNFLRKSWIDELPQFINVLRGDMSLVGPRPYMVLHTEEYKKRIDNYMMRHICKPGITGWAQANGLRGEIKTPEQLVERFEYDQWYIENWSLYLDLKILLKTVFDFLTFANAKGKP